MKQRIVKISDIKFTRPIKIKKPVDITQTYIYNGLKRFISDDELIKKSHTGFALAQLLNFYDCTYDIDTLTPDDDEYQEAVDEIKSYVETAWSMRDANLVSSAQIELSDEYYNVEHQTLLYMYFADWIEFGYKPFIRPCDWETAFHQVIYEYMRQFLTIKIC